MTKASRTMLLGLGVAATLGLGAGVAFAGWAEHAGTIFLSLAQSGLAWCF